MGDAVHTPEFLIWALEYSCPIRALQNGHDPERTERQLRAARAVSDAQREGRVFEGLCVRPPYGFRAADALAVYGGQGAVETACGNCRANALASHDRRSLAGCYGTVVLPQEQAEFHRSIDAAVCSCGDSLAGHTAITTPTWYGLWMNSPLTRESAAAAASLLEVAATYETIDGLDELVIALRWSSEHGIPLHVALYPRGRVEATQWILATHCPRCKATWASDSQRYCALCGYSGPPAQQRQRKARGQRPYFPLARLLGPAAADEFLARYAAFQKRAESTRPAQNPLPLAPPNSLPAD